MNGGAGSTRFLYNFNTNIDNTGCKGLPGELVTVAPSASTTLLLVESPVFSNVLGYNGSSVVAPEALTTSVNPAQNRSETGSSFGTGAPATDIINPIHLGGWNYLFLHGHVKFLRPQATIDSNPSDSLTGIMTSPRGMWTTAETD